jgi:hypothetical protein
MAEDQMTFPPSQVSSIQDEDHNLRVRHPREKPVAPRKPVTPAKAGAMDDDWTM